MWQRLADRLRQLSDRLRYPGKSVQYELQRMTPPGGWKNFYTDPNYDSADAFPTPPPRPSFGSETGYPPGKYQCLKRVDGRIETTVWIVESPAVDAYYADLREQATAAESRTADTDGGTATTSAGVADAAAADAEATATDHDALTQRLMEETADGSRTAALGLGMIEWFDDDDTAATSAAEGDDGDDTDDPSE